MHFCSGILSLRSFSKKCHIYVIVIHKLIKTSNNFIKFDTHDKKKVKAVL